jgi:hypothetical protein
VVDHPSARLRRPRGSPTRGSDDALPRPDAQRHAPRQRDTVPRRPGVRRGRGGGHPRRAPRPGGSSARRPGAPQRPPTGPDRGPRPQQRPVRRRPLGRPTCHQRRLSPVTGDAPRARRDQTRHPAGPPTRSHTCRDRADNWGAPRRSRCAANTNRSRSLYPRHSGDRYRPSYRPVSSPDPYGPDPYGPGPTPGSEPGTDPESDSPTTSSD